jgi:asparagine synthase (glutamine-hydrolysing)
MCGIYGEVVVEAPEELRTTFARSAAASLRHRGPDGEGVWSDDHCLLGHLRLAIIDLTTHAAQPMKSASGRSHMVFNGEIYNFVELRAAMRPPDNGWRSTSDTEVLLEALDRDGPEAISKALGMFALAVWSPFKRELLLMRDRLGKKPLYYARTVDGRLRFASEVDALLRDGAVHRETTADRIAEFLQLGYVAAPRTAFTSIHAVPPGCWLRITLEDGAITHELQRYWDLPAPGAAPGFRDIQSWSEQFEHTLRDAVRIRLRADVPLGAFLSGGIDSSVISLLASQQIPGKLRTFTVDFEEGGWSEGPFAAEVAAHIGSEHVELRLSPDSLSSIPDLVATYGDLHGDSSALPTIALCRAARQYVTVALAGDGGDELLGGYTRYAGALRTTATAARIPRPAVALARLLARRRPLAWMRGASRIARLSGDPAEYYAREMRGYLADPWPAVLRRPQSRSWPDPVAASLAEQAGRPPLLQFMACDAKTYLPEDILVKVDRASMAYGLEVRAPLLDHRLMELVMGADPTWLTGPGGSKRPLRRLFGPRLPASVFNRPKMGFGVPVARWLRESTDQTQALLDPTAAVAPLLEPWAVRRLLLSHRLRMNDESGRIWRLLVLQAWFELWRPTL